MQRDQNLPALPRTIFYPPPTPPKLVMTGQSGGIGPRSTGPGGIRSIGDGGSNESISSDSKSSFSKVKNNV